MADSTVAALPAATTLDGTELYYGVQAAADTKVTGAQIKTLAGSYTLTLSGNVSAAAWTVTGIGLVGAAANFTDTSSSGTVANMYVNRFGIPTILASSATTYTNAYGTWFEPPTASTNVTVTRGFAAGFNGQIGVVDGSTTNPSITAISASAGNPTGIYFTAGTDFGTNIVSNGFQALNVTASQIRAFTNFGAHPSVATSSVGKFCWSNDSSNPMQTKDTFLTRPAAATIQQGDADAAAPVAQTITAQSVVAGTSNTAGADWTIAGSKGTGTGAGGSIVFKTAAAGGSGSSQNALGTAMTIDGAQNVVIPTGYLQVSSAGSSGTPALQIFNDGRGFWAANGGVAFKGSGGNFWGNDGNSGFGVWSSTPDFVHVGFGTSSTLDVFLSRAAAAALQLGNNDAAAPVAQTLQVQSVVAGTTDTAGTDWTRTGSKGTGTGAGGNLVNKTAFSAKSTGTGQGTTVDRHIVVAKGKVLTSAAAFSMFDVALPTLTMCGGVIEATIVCTDGTDMQSFTQTVTYSAVNKGGVYTTSITPSTGDKSVSSGTLTTAWSIVSGTNKITVKVTPTTSLTPSTNAFLLYYTVRNNSEQATTIL